MKGANRYRLGVKCLDCGAVRYASRQELGRRSARVRCLKCGGPTELSRQGSGKMAGSQDVVNEQKVHFSRQQKDPAFWKGQTPQEGARSPQDQLRAEHGTPEEFEKATWIAYFNREITDGEAISRITRYRRQWVAAGNAANRAAVLADPPDDQEDG